MSHSPSTQLSSVQAVVLCTVQRPDVVRVLDILLHLSENTIPVRLTDPSFPLVEPCCPYSSLGGITNAIEKTSPRFAHNIVLYEQWRE